MTIQRSLFLAVFIACFCAVQTFATTYVGGAENSEPNTTVEGIGDYNDFIFSLSNSSLQLVSLDSGTWSALSGVTLQHTTTNPAGQPFWDNPSLDDTAGSPKNIGYCVETVSSTNNCSLPLTTPAVTEYLSVSKAPDNDFYFTFSGGTITASFLNAIASSLGPGESLGWYNPSNFAQFGTIIAEGATIGSNVVFTPSSTFGLFFTVAGTNSGFATQNSLDNGNGAGTTESRFAMFELPNAEGVPEPGTMALFGLGALMLGLLPRLRRRN